MPQVFQVLRCYKCMAFQVHQTKKSNKFQCKLCGEKQSIKRHYGVGTAKDCRLHVQKLNGIRGEIDDLKESKTSDSDKEENEPAVNIPSQAKSSEVNKSKWSAYVDNDHEGINLKPDKETMYFNDAEVVLEMPKKRKRTSFKCPSIKTSTASVENYSCGENVSTNPSVNICTLPRASNGVSSYNSFKSRVHNKTESKIENCEEITPPVVNQKKELFKFLPAKVSNNSKWAQFVEKEPDSEVGEDSSCEEPDKNLNSGYPEKSLRDVKISQELFALCDESDLDNVLDI